MARKVLDVEFTIGVNEPDGARCNVIVVNVAGHDGMSKSSNAQIREFIQANRGLFELAYLHRGRSILPA